MGFSYSFFIMKPLLLLLVILHLLGCTSSYDSVRCAESERVALLDFKKSFVSRYPDDKLSSWKSFEENCCNWDGVLCEDGHVVGIALGFESLQSNQLRPSLLQLEYLEFLILSWNYFAMKIPDFIGSLTNLVYLDLSNSGFYGTIPSHLGNLSNVFYLNVGTNLLSSESLGWLSCLSSLGFLDMSYSNFSEARDWSSAIGNLPSLSSFSCSSCSLPSTTTSDHVNSSFNLQTLDLSNSTLYSPTISWLMNNTPNLSSLTLKYVNLEGPILQLFHHLKSLQTLDVSGSNFGEELFKSIGSTICNFKELTADGCFNNHTIEDVLQTLTAPCATTSLKTLSLISNNLTGNIPLMLKFPLLTQLYLADNRLHGLLSDAHFANISQLYALDVGNNPTLSVTLTEPPPILSMSSCKIGPQFPIWLTKRSFSALDISNCNISGSIPLMFWKNQLTNLGDLNLSFNNFHDNIPNLPFVFHDILKSIDLSSNVFYGPIPYSLLNANFVDLSNNRFSSIAPNPNSTTALSTESSIIALFTQFSFIGVYKRKSLDISNNLLSGVLPDWFWLRVTSLQFLNLANNNFSGSILSSIGGIPILNVLVLHNNKFSGELPLWLRNCTRLGVLDLSKNNFDGFIPSWIGENLKSLVVLSLGYNNLSGNIPSSLFHLSSLQIIDLSHNSLHGNLPKSVQNFTSMVQNDDSSFIVWDSDGVLVGQTPLKEASFFQAFIKWKGLEYLFHTILHMVKLIDLSSNNFSGEIPIGFTKLLALNSLDLSNNHFSGDIPKQIGQLKSLEILNLSNNRLSGELPSSMSAMFSLDFFDVSHNNLSGEIPTSTQLQSFDPSAYGENPGLCGVPLPIKCHKDEATPSPNSEENISEGFDMESFYSAMGFGFAFGFLLVLGTLNFIANWRHAFYRFASHFADWIMLVVALNVARVSRKFRS